MHGATYTPDDRLPGDELTLAVSDPEAPVARALTAAGSAVLAVSGGRDSIALLHAAARTVKDRIAAVATFDHGSGNEARMAADLVVAVAERLGVRCVRGRAPNDIERTEAGWRAARWRFLRSVADVSGRCPIVTAHTLDDQVETVFIRAMRQAGARGLAALDIEGGDVIRPWIRTSRESVARYAHRWRLKHVEDPTNTSRAFLRNRVRHDLLPALRAVHPEIDRELIAIGVKAAAWRRQVEDLVVVAFPLRIEADGVSVAAHDLAGYDAASLAIIWPVIAARARVTLDRRGTARVTEFTCHARLGAVIQVSGGFEVQRSRFSFVVRRPGYSPAVDDPARWTNGGTGLEWVPRPVTAGRE